MPIENEWLSANLEIDKTVTVSRAVRLSEATMKVLIKTIMSEAIADPGIRISKAKRHYSNSLGLYEWSRTDRTRVLFSNTPTGSLMDFSHPS